jgi:hypothetical protein
MLLLDDSSLEAVVVDNAVPASSAKLRDALAQAWPRLSNRVRIVSADIETFELFATDVVVSSHACGATSDRVLARAAAVRARVAVLPCCHDLATCNMGPLAGWMDAALAIDTMRAVRLEAQGYRVWTQTIPEAITPKNRLLLGAPS